MTPKILVAAARGFLGVRFKHQGRDAAEGLDCLGLLLAVAHEVGLHVEDERRYGSKPDTEFLQQRLEAYLSRITSHESRITTGDILLLAIDGRPQHLAMVTDYPVAGEWGIIHAYAPARKVVEHRLSNDWKQKIAGVYVIPAYAGISRRLLEPVSGDPATSAG